jgi:hypothetical protein
LGYHSRMAKDEIIYKLDAFLRGHDTLGEEAHVTYLMVETRKVIDQTGSAKTYPLLKFYADWAVHSRKDRITAEIEALSEQMYAAVVEEITAPYPGLSRGRSPVLAFVYMDDLRREMERFLIHNSLDDTLATNQDSWIAFVSLLVKILENQPIAEPSQNVKTICFEPAKARCVIGTIVFRQPVNGYDHYTIKNAY